MYRGTNSNQYKVGKYGRKPLSTGRLAAAAVAGLVASQPAAAQVSIAEGVHAGELAVPVNKSQVLRTDRPYAKALIGNPDIADILPLSDRSLYVLGKKTGTTSLTLYDRRSQLIAVLDIAVGPDVITLKRQLSELIPGDDISARMSNDSVILEGTVSSSIAADRAVQVAETFAPGKVVNLLALGSAQQVMLEVRFSEIKRSALTQVGLNWDILSDHSKLQGIVGGGSSLSGSVDPVTGRLPLKHGAILDSFGIISRAFRGLGENFNVTLDALEKKGAITTLAEPTLIALSGETASFLAGGEFPVPVVQSAAAARAARTAAAAPRSRSNGSRSASASPSPRRC